MGLLQSLFGILFFTSFVALISKNRKNISLRFVLTGISLQFILAFILLKVTFISDLLLSLNRIISSLQTASLKSTQFMFGYLAGGTTPFEITEPSNMFIVAFQVLPLILVIGSLFSLLFHFGILSFIVNLFSKLLRTVFPISGALGFGAASSLFLGTIETPLAIKPYLKKLSSSELLSLIVCTMSTVAGTVIVLYSSVLTNIVPNAITHLLTASVISIPAALTLSHIFSPSLTDSTLDINIEKPKITWVESFLNSIKDGLQMISSIVAIIIVLFAFINLIDQGLSSIHPDVSLNYLMGQILRPIMWLVGFSWESSAAAAELMGTKIVLNEFVSYLNLGQLQSFTPKETLLAVYSLCGFANLASCGIVVAGLTALLPERRNEIVQHTFWALLLGNLTTLMTACVFNIMS